MKPDGRDIPVTVTSIQNEDGEEMESAPHAKQILYLKLTPDVGEVYDILRVHG